MKHFEKGMHNVEGVHKYVNLPVMILVFIAEGCSHTIYERKKSETDPLDQGSETENQLQGPRPGVKHWF